MTFSQFVELVTRTPDGAVLLEGRRAIPASSATRAERLARSLALRFPLLRFRSGNAEGADDAFSRGVAANDPGRLQIVAPYASHRMSLRHPGARYDSPESLSVPQEAAMIHRTATASPKNRGLLAQHRRKGPLAAKAAYLIRDTMKVTGHSEVFQRPICALFYVSLEDPEAGGTGHTIRVCRLEEVPVAFQDSWEQWPTE